MTFMLRHPISAERGKGSEAYRLCRSFDHRNNLIGNRLIELIASEFEGSWIRSDILGPRLDNPTEWNFQTLFLVLRMTAQNPWKFSAAFSRNIRVPWRLTGDCERSEERFREIRGLFFCELSTPPVFCYLLFTV